MRWIEAWSVRYHPGARVSCRTPTRVDPGPGRGGRDVLGAEPGRAFAGAHAPAGRTCPIARGGGRGQRRKGAAGWRRDHPALARCGRRLWPRHAHARQAEPARAYVEAARRLRPGSATPNARVAAGATITSSTRSTRASPRCLGGRALRQLLHSHTPPVAEIALRQSSTGSPPKEPIHLSRRRFTPQSTSTVADVQSTTYAQTYPN